VPQNWELVAAAQSFVRQGSCEYGSPSVGALPPEDQGLL
jgi:hypothetical protein